jgi:hypothetical protein
LRELITISYATMYSGGVIAIILIIVLFRITGKDSK